MTSPVASETLERADESKARPAPPGAMVIFGATGDLTKRKLLPALYNLVVDGLLPDEFAVPDFERHVVDGDDVAGEHLRDVLKRNVCHVAGAGRGRRA